MVYVKSGYFEAVDFLCRPAMRQMLCACVVEPAVRLMMSMPGGLGAYPHDATCDGVESAFRGETVESRQ